MQLRTGECARGKRRLHFAVIEPVVHNPDPDSRVGDMACLTVSVRKRPNLDVTPIVAVVATANWRARWSSIRTGSR